MLRYSSKPAKREVRRVTTEARKQDKSFPILDCWGNKVGLVGPDGACHSTNLSQRQIVHIVCGMLVAKPRAERDGSHTKALKDIRALGAFGKGGLV